MTSNEQRNKEDGSRSFFFTRLGRSWVFEKKKEKKEKKLKKNDVSVKKIKQDESREKEHLEFNETNQMSFMYLYVGDYT